MIDNTALFKISYGLYVISCNDGKKDNGFICNTVVQVTDNPKRVAVTINKLNYSHDVIKETGKMLVNSLNTDTPFSVFERFGFQSGRDADKFEGFESWRTSSGLLALTADYINSFISLKVFSEIDLGTHTMFICDVTEAMTLTDSDSMTYDYYHKNVKPKKTASKKKGYICKICGYVYEHEPLPSDFICPICKHGAEDFEPIA